MEEEGGVIETEDPDSHSTIIPLTVTAQILRDAGHVKANLLQLPQYLFSGMTIQLVPKLNHQSSCLAK